jgi:hypothetical protein
LNHIDIELIHLVHILHDHLIHILHLHDTVLDHLSVDDIQVDEVDDEVDEDDGNILIKIIQ